MLKKDGDWYESIEVTLWSYGNGKAVEAFSISLGLLCFFFNCLYCVVRINNCKIMQVNVRWTIVLKVLLTKKDGGRIASKSFMNGIARPPLMKKRSFFRSIDRAAFAFYSFGSRILKEKKRLFFSFTKHN